MTLTNASRPGRTGSPVTPDQLARLRAQLANGQGEGHVEVRWSDLANAVHDLDVLVRLREVAARAVVPAVHPDVVHDLVRDDHRLRDEARDRPCHRSTAARRCADWAPRPKTTDSRAKRCGP